VVPTVATIGWALGMGVVGALPGCVILWSGLSLHPGPYSQESSRIYRRGF